MKVYRCTRTLCSMLMNIYEGRISARGLQTFPSKQLQSRDNEFKSGAYVSQNCKDLCRNRKWVLARDRKQLGVRCLCFVTLHQIRILQVRVTGSLIDSLLALSCTRNHNTKLHTVMRNMYCIKFPNEADKAYSVRTRSYK